MDRAWKVLVEQRADVNNVDPTETEFYDLFQENKTKLYWPTSNFTEQARMMLQYVDEDSDASNYAYASIGYKINILYISNIYFLYFVFTYLKKNNIYGIFNINSSISRINISNRQDE